MVKPCQACGFILSVAKKYCDACGEPQSFEQSKGPAKPPPIAPPPPPAPKPKEPPRREPTPPPEPVRKEREEQVSIELPPVEASRGDAWKTEPPKPLRDTEPPGKDRLPEKARQDGLSLKPPASPTHKTAEEKAAEFEKYIPKTMISHIDRGEPPSEEKPKAPPPKDERPKDQPRPVGDRAAGHDHDHKRALPEKVEPPPSPAPKPEQKRESARERFERELAERERLKASGKDRSRERPREAPRHAARPSFTDTMVTMSRNLRQPKAIFSTSLALFLIASGSLVYFYHQHSRQSPQRTLIDAAGKYLFSLKEKNFGAAYALLSAGARRTCRLDDFEKLQKSPDWMFDEVEIAAIDKDRALVRYRLHVSEKPTEEDWLEFVREEGGWRRAYWWHLMGPIEDDLAAGDFPRARARAEAGLAIQPDEALLLSYLCEAAHGAGDFAAAERACLRTLETVQGRPPRLDEKDLFHVRAILADAYRNTPGKLAEAARYYDILLKSPGLPDGDRCAIQLALADAMFLSGDHSKSRVAYEEAGRSCTHVEDAAYLKRNIRMLSGQAGPEAVAQAKSHRMPDPMNPANELSLLDWRREARKELAQRLHLPFKADSTDEDWTSEHAGGALYRVTVRNKGTLVLSAQTDIWNRTTEVKIER